MAFALDVKLQIKDIVDLVGVKQKIAKITGDTGKGAKTTGAVAAQHDKASAAALRQAKALEKLAISESKVAATSKKLASSVRTSGKALDSGGKSAKTFGNSVALAGKRYAAFLAATAVPFVILGSLKQAIQSVVEFENTMNRLSQTLDKPVSQLGELRQSLLDLAVQTGTSQKDISSMAETLARAGILARQGAEGMKAWLEPLAKIPLVASFKDVESSTNAVIASLNQFKDAGLTPLQVLDKLNNVSKKYAVTADELGRGISIAGGAFSQLGGNIDELIAVLTTLRSVTRESMSTLAVSIRTITSRLARMRNIRFLEGIGVQVRDATGDLLSLRSIVENLAPVFERSTKIQKAQIGEMLGGYRQLARVMALVGNEAIVQQAFIESARKSAGSFNRDAAIGAESLKAKIGQLVGEFNKLVQSLADPIFIPFVDTLLAIGKSFVFVLDALRPILPLFAKLAAASVGILAVNTSIKLLTKSMLILQGLQLPALLAGGGAAAASKVRQSGFAGQMGGTTIIPSFRDRVGGGVSAAGRFADTQLGGFAILAGLNVAAGSLEKHFKNAGNSAGELATATLKAATIILGAASLISGKSLAGIFGGAAKAGAAGELSGLLTGGLGAVAGVAGITSAALGVGATIVSFKNAQKAVDDLINKTVEEIGSIDVDMLGAQEAFDEMGRKVSDGINRASDQFDPDTISGAFAGLGDRVVKLVGAIFSGDIFSGDLRGALSKENLTQTQTQDIIKRIVGDNPGKLNEIIGSAMEEFGIDWAANLGKTKDIQRWAKQIGTGSTDLVKEIFQQADPTEITKIAREIADKLKQQRIAERISDLAADFAKIHVPEQITSELQKLQFAVKTTAESISNSAQIFSNLLGVIGRIQAPGIAGEVDLKDFIKNFDISELQGFGPGNSPGIGRLAETYSQIINLTDDFVAGLIGSKALAKLQNTLGNTSIRPMEQLADFVEDQMQTFGDRIPEGIKPQMRQLFEDIGGEIQTAMKDVPLTPEGIEEIIRKRTENLGQGVIAALGGSLKIMLDLAALKVTQNLQALATEISISIGEAKVPETILGTLRDQLRSLGLTDFGEPFSKLETFDVTRNIESGAKAVFSSSEAMKQFMDRYAVALDEQGNALEKISSLRAAGKLAESTKVMQEELEPASEKVLLFKGAILGLQKTIPITRAILEKELSAMDRNSIQFQTKLKIRQKESQLQSLALIEEQLSRTAKLLELEAAKTAGLKPQEPQKIFSSAVDNFNKAVNRLLKMRLPTQREIELSKQTPEERRQREQGFVVKENKLTFTQEAPTEKLQEKREQVAFGADTTFIAKTVKQVLQEGMKNFKVDSESTWEAIKSKFTGRELDFPKDFDIETASTKDLADQLRNLDPNKFLRALNIIADIVQQRLLSDDTPRLRDLGPESQSQQTANLIDAIKAITQGEKVPDPQFTQDMFKSISAIEKLAGVRGEIPAEIGLDQDARNTFDNIDSAADSIREGAASLSSKQGEVVQEATNLKESAASLESGTKELSVAVDNLQPAEIAKDAAQPPKESPLGESVINALDRQIQENSANAESAGISLDSVSQNIEKVSSDIVNTTSAVNSVELEIVKLGTIMTGDSSVRADDIGSQASRDTVGQTIVDDVVPVDFSQFTNLIELFGGAVNQNSVASDKMLQGTESFFSAVREISDAAGIFQTAISSLGAHLDNNRTINVDTTSVGLDTNLGDKLVSASEGTQASISDLSEKIGVVFEKFQTNIQETFAQVAKDIQLGAEEIQIPGLIENAEATALNTETVGVNSEGNLAMAEQMAKTADTIERGVDVKIEAMQELDVDITGLNEVVDTFTSEFEAVATKVASALIRQALQQLAASAGGGKEATSFSQVAGGF